MEIGIQVMWWIGLVGALVSTLVIVKQVLLVVRVLRGILRLAERTRTAARGIASNVGAVQGLEGLEQLLRPIPGALTATASPAVALAHRLDAALER